MRIIGYGTKVEDVADVDDGNFDGFVRKPKVVQMVTTTCGHCGKEFEQPKKLGPPRKTCSKQCAATLMHTWHSSRPKKEKEPVKMVVGTCPECGTDFERRELSHKKYCQRACAVAWGNRNRGLKKKKVHRKKKVQRKKRLPKKRNSGPRLPSTLVTSICCHCEMPFERELNKPRRYCSPKCRGDVAYEKAKKQKARFNNLSNKAKLEIQRAREAKARKAARKKFKESQKKKP